MTELWEHVQEMIREHGSIRALAKAVMVDHSYIQRLALGEKTNPSEKILRKLGIVKSVTVTYQRVD